MAAPAEEPAVSSRGERAPQIEIERAPSSPGGEDGACGDRPVFSLDGDRESLAQVPGDALDPSSETHVAPLRGGDVREHRVEEESRQPERRPRERKLDRTPAAEKNAPRPMVSPRGSDSPPAPRASRSSIASGERNSPQTLWRGNRSRSSTTTENPRRPSAIAAQDPAGPPPTTATSNRFRGRAAPRAAAMPPRAPSTKRKGRVDRAWTPRRPARRATAAASRAV